MIAFSVLSTARCRAQAPEFSTPIRGSNDNPKLGAEIVDALITRCGMHPGFPSPTIGVSAIYCRLCSGSEGGFPRGKSNQ